MTPPPPGIPSGLGTILERLIFDPREPLLDPFWPKLVRAACPALASPSAHCYEGHVPTPSHQAMPPPPPSMLQFNGRL